MGMDAGSTVSPPPERPVPPITLLGVWRLIAVGLSVGVLAAGCGGGEEDSGAGDGHQSESNLLVQTAESGGFTGTGQDVTLTLRPVSAVTTVFSDRPERDSGTITTAEFASTFDQAFGDDPPNADVSSLERGRGQFTVELSDPRYDEATRTLTYAARPIGADGSDLPGRIGPVSVFIDSGICLTYVNNSSDAPGGVIISP